MSRPKCDVKRPSDGAPCRLYLDEPHPNGHQWPPKADELEAAWPGYPRRFTLPSGSSVEIAFVEPAADEYVIAIDGVNLSVTLDCYPHPHRKHPNDLIVNDAELGAALEAAVVLGAVEGAEVSPMSATRVEAVSALARALDVTRRRGAFEREQVEGLLVLALRSLGFTVSHDRIAPSVKNDWKVADAAEALRAAMAGQDYFTADDSASGLAGIVEGGMFEDACPPAGNDVPAAVRALVEAALSGGGRREGHQ